jgi:hypothetical protein
MIVRSNRNVILLCTSAMLVLAALLAPARASAQALCTPVNIPPTAASPVFDVEGKITAFDRANRTITANGLTFTVPSVLLVETRDLELTGNITFDTLTDPALEAQRSIIGGTVIATGTASFTAVGTGFCISSTASQVFVELAENGLVGVLSDVAPANGSFRVNGVLVRMNTDPRFPSDLLDIGGNPIAIADLVGFEGTEVTAGGYFDAAQGVLLGTSVETEALQSQPGTDSVAITRAEGRVGNAELRLEGVNTRSPQTGQFATSVTLHRGGLDAAGTGCAGTQLGTAPVSAVDGTWQLRIRNITQIPTQVCAKSPLGGVATRAVTFN